MTNLLFHRPGAFPAQQGEPARAHVRACGLGAARSRRAGPRSGPATHHSIVQWLPARRVWLCAQLYHGRFS